MNPATYLMVAKLAEMAQRGLTYEEAAAEAGVGYHYVASFARRHNLTFKMKPRGRPLKMHKDGRSHDMRLLYESGLTLVQIGQRYGITRERVRQIMTRDYGIRARDGGQAEVARRRRRDVAKLRDARCQKAWGCSYRQYRKILKSPGKPTYGYIGQRRNARERGIPFEITLWQWFQVWQQSGHWSKRGRGADAYCMCRLNDNGPYSVDNVYIATIRENMQDYWVNRRAASSLEATQ